MIILLIASLFRSSFCTEKSSDLISTTSLIKCLLLTVSVILMRSKCYYLWI